MALCRVHGVFRAQPGNPRRGQPAGQRSAPASLNAAAGNWRWPAEWEPQDAVLIAWPHAGTDWADQLDQVEASYVALAAAVTRFERLLICVSDALLADRARQLLAGHGVPADRVLLIEVPYDDTWLRDSGPLSLVDGQGAFRLADFRFTGWGGKFEASRDDQLIAGLLARGVFQHAAHQRIDWALEGGAVESDGGGSILTTWHCLHSRHPDSSREELADKLCRPLAADRVLWLDHGALEGDDTDAHIDTLARFAPHHAIVYQACDEPSDSHHGALAAMAGELAALRTRDGAPYTLHPLPWPRPIREHGRRLPASYANYLIINGAVLVPAYDDPADTEATRVIGLAHPGREILPIPCRPLIRQNGSLHCLTMQLPAGLLATGQNPRSARS